eukprot:Sspe_Gene.48029::Locus_24745_Transcript_1_1_Confidence_1.000_Length_1746::g.48029::m.48029
MGTGHPTATPHRPTEGVKQPSTMASEQPFAAVLGGSHVVRCPLPSEGEAVSDEAQSDTSIAGSEAVRIVFFSPNLVPLPNTRWHGRAVINRSAHVDLGWISTRREHTESSARV